AYKCAEYLDKATFGFDLYVTEDGVNFTKITDNGFGDPYNHGCRAFGITNEGLFIGTANPFYGTQVWKLSEKTVTPVESSEESKQEDSKIEKDESKTESSSENSTDSPKTGDSSNGIAYFLAGLSLIAIVYTMNKKLFKKN
uniref:LPXTG cell wall anchor domain-containing protein n=1 Tax=Escherichia coli TaxID=562 RepID=UPI001323F1A4